MLTKNIKKTVAETDKPGFLRTDSRIDKSTTVTANQSSCKDLSSRILKELYEKAEIIDTGSNHLPELFQNSTKFCVLAAKIDNFDSFSEEDDLHEILNCTGSVITSLIDENGGTWGWLEPDTAYCFVPQKNHDQGKILSNEVKLNISKSSSATVTIGIAAYPLINFPRENILENAIKAIDHASFFGPDSIVIFDAVSLNISGDKLYQQGYIEEAAKEFSKALMIDPASVNLHNSLGVCYGMVADHEKALNEFETASWLDENELMALHNMGIIHDIKGDKEKALEYLSRAVSIKDDIFEILFHTGRLYFEVKKPEEAVVYLEKAVTICPESDPAHRFIGKTYQALNMEDKAISAYKKAVKLNPYDSESLSALGYLFGIQNKDAEISEIFCQTSVSLAPENSLFRHRLGKALLDLGKKEEALSAFQKAEELGFTAADADEKDEFSEFKQYYNG